MNESIEYTDKEQNAVKFPDPTVYVDCGEVIEPEPCTEPRELVAEGCTEAVTFDAGELSLAAQGRIVELSLTMVNVCPRRRVALAVLLTDGEEDGYRALKTFAIPAHCGPDCRDVRIEGIRFVVPDSSGHCAGRRLYAQTMANYMDTDFDCE